MARIRSMVPSLRSAAACAVVLTLMSGSAAASDPMAGALRYRQHCAHCHGDNGRPVMPGAPDFTRPMALMKPDLALLEVVRGGRGAMPAYAGVLRDREILDVVAHLRTLR